MTPAARGLLQAVGDEGVAPALVRLLEREPDLAVGVEPSQLDRARARTVAPLVTLPAGRFRPEDLAHGDGPAPFTALVLDGLLVRDCALQGRVITQIIGPGDVVPILPPAAEHLDLEARWQAVVPTELALLDDHFLAAAQRWPSLTARLAERAAMWADRALVAQAISQMARVDERLLLLLRHLALRMGKVTADGVLVPLALTHAALGTMVGAKRSTVTLALGELVTRGAVARHDEGWLLSHAAFDGEGAVGDQSIPQGDQAIGVRHTRVLRDARQVRSRAAATRELAAEQAERARSMRGDEVPVD